MNKLFVFAMLALAATCFAAPTEETKPLEPVTAETDLPTLNAEKRAILYRAPIGAYYPGYAGYAANAGYAGYPGYAGYAGYPAGYRYRAALPASAHSYLSYPTASHYGSYYI